MDFITAENVSFAYNINEQLNKVALSDVSFSLKKGEFVSIIGHNGCGKSTLSKLLNCLLTPQKGKIYVDGLDTSVEENQGVIRKNVGLVLQNPDNQLVASIVEEDVAFGPENLGIDPKEIRKRVDNALKAVDMYDFRLSAPYKLSGGQKQRVAIAGIIAMEPSCIVLDESTAMLDPSGREEVIETVKKLNKEKGITVILITHNMDEAVLADKVIVMSKSEIITTGTPDEVFTKVELLKKHRLDVPQATELSYKLRAMGVEIDKLPLTEDECISILKEVLK